TETVEASRQYRLNIGCARRKRLPAIGGQQRDELFGKQWAALGERNDAILRCCVHARPNRQVVDKRAGPFRRQWAELERSDPPRAHRLVPRAAAARVSHAYHHPPPRGRFHATATA